MNSGQVVAIMLQIAGVMLIMAGSILSLIKIFAQQKLIAALRLKIEMLEHPERFPPQHPNCRSQGGYLWDGQLHAKPEPQEWMRP